VNDEPVTEPDLHGRVPYPLLTDAEKQAIHDWCSLHNIDHTLVPIEGMIELDPATREWRIETYVKGANGSGIRITADGTDAVRIVVRRVWRADLPWRMA
jgi:hypothetical protein